MRRSAEISAPGKIAPLGDFTNALVNPDLPTPKGVIGPGGAKADKRFNVYRNNVTVGLVNALVDIFPAVHRLVGDAFFRQMARIYVQAERPRSPLLFEYGGTFPQFLETFAPVKHLSYLADVARLERQWLDAFHAADSPVLEAQDLAAVNPEDLPQARFTRHPAAHVLRSSFAVVSIFSANRSGQSLADIDPDAAEDGLVSRPHHDVEVRQLPPGAAVFLTMLMDGETLGQAASQAADEAEGFDLATAISGMLEAGIFARISINRNSKRETIHDQSD